MTKVNPLLRGLIYLSHTEINNATLQGLNPNDAATLDSTYVDLAHPFLAKRFRMWYAWDQDADDLAVLLYLSAPGVSEAETEIALEQTTGDPKDHSNVFQKGQGERIINSTIFSIASENHNPASTRSYAGYSGWMTIGAKGAGIPYPGGTNRGPEIHAYNYDKSVILGTTLIHYVYQIEGVWLND